MSEGRQYRILETIGKGGFGTVYKAELQGAGGFAKVVALKVLNDSVAEVEGTSERLRDEARMLGLIRHRAIVAVDALVKLNGHWTVVMEYVDGVDLKRLLSAGRLPPGPAIEIITEVANALFVAYERPSNNGEPLHVLHRDIKPSNIQLSATGDVKVLDFGVARAEFATREARTRALAFGSLGYMSPERLDNVDTHAGDVYALGAVLFELLVADPLGKTPGVRERHAAFLDAALERLWEAVPNADLQQLMADCLAYEEGSRPPARELERRLRTLRQQFSDAWLSDWAEDVVPPLQAAPLSQTDPLAGALLVEDAIAPVVAPAPSRTWPEHESSVSREGDAREEEGRSRIMPLIAVSAAMFSAVLVVGLGGGLMYWMSQRRAADATEAGLVAGSDASGEATPEGSPEATPEAAPEAAPEATPPVAPQATPEAAPEATPEAAPEAAPEATPEASPEATPEESPATPTEASAPSSTPRVTRTYGTVMIQGDVAGVTLVKGSRTYKAGKVPTGTYTIRAPFEGAAIDAGTVTVTKDATVTVSCKLRFKLCVVL